MTPWQICYSGKAGEQLAGALNAGLAQRAIVVRPVGVSPQPELPVLAIWTSRCGLGRKLPRLHAASLHLDFGGCTLPANIDPTTIVSYGRPWPGSAELSDAFLDEVARRITDQSGKLAQIERILGRLDRTRASKIVKSLRSSVVPIVSSLLVALGISGATIWVSSTDLGLGLLGRMTHGTLGIAPAEQRAFAALPSEATGMQIETFLRVHSHGHYAARVRQALSNLREVPQEVKRTGTSSVSPVLIGPLPIEFAKGNISLEQLRVVGEKTALGQCRAIPPPATKYGEGSIRVLNANIEPLPGTNTLVVKCLVHEEYLDPQPRYVIPGK